MLAEGIEIGGAWLDNGLLHIDLFRPQPEVRVKRIEIMQAGQKAHPVNGAAALKPRSARVLHTVDEREGN